MDLITAAILIQKKRLKVKLIIVIMTTRSRMKEARIRRMTMRTKETTSHRKRNQRKTTKTE